MAIYYIATTGGDGNPGTLAQPWRTIAKANSTLVPGDTVRIRTGTYAERIIPVNSGTPGNLITYENYQSEVVTVRGQAGQRAIAYLSEDYICLDGLVFSHIDVLLDVKFGWIELRGDHNQVLDCTLIRTGDPQQMYVDDYRERGITVYGADALIDGNYIKGHNQAIHIRKTAGRTTITNNTLTETGQSLIVVDTSHNTMRGLLIENNVIERSVIEDGIAFQPDFDIGDDQYTDTSSNGVILRHNIIRYNSENAIDLKGAAFIVIEDNLIYGTIGSLDGGLNGWDRAGSSTIMKGTPYATKNVIIRHNILYDNRGGIHPYDGYRIYNNTCAGNNRDYTGPDSGFYAAAKPYFYALHRTATGTIKIVNNIMIGHNHIDVSLRTSRIAYINSNLYYNTEVSLHFCNFVDNGNWTTYNFTDWKLHLQGAGNVTGEDAASVEANPNFTVAPERPESDDTNPAGEYTRSDFDLQAGSPAIDAGEVLTHANGGGTGTVITIDDALWFFDGYGITSGDEINVGGDIVTIINVDYGANQITIDQVITWVNNDPISLVYNGAAPDIGAREYPPGATTTSTSSSTTSTSTSTSLSTTSSSTTSTSLSMTSTSLSTTSSSTTSTSLSTTSTSLSTTSTSTTSTSLSTTSTSLSTTSTSTTSTSLSTSTSVTTSTSISTTSTSLTTTSTSISTTSTSLTTTSTSTTSTSLSTTLRLIFHLRGDAVLSMRYAERA